MKIVETGMKLLFAGMVCLPLSVHANTLDDDPMIQGARMCTQYLPRHEREFGIPMHLLAAISSTESGRYHKGLGLRLPWPWTINAEGQGYFFPTKEEAIAAVQRLQAKGIHSIDVGCMQVNLMHHAGAFATLEDAFDPAHNVSYAATFLHNNFEEMKSWRSATAAYHSRTPTYGNQYVVEVFSTWNQILNKVSQAKSGTLMLAKNNWDMPKFSRAADVDYQAPKPGMQIAHYNKDGHPRVHVYGLSSYARKEHGILVIRPQNESVVAGSAVSVADNSPVISARQEAAQPHPKIIHIGNDTVNMGNSSSISVERHPQMVFDN